MRLQHTKNKANVWKTVEIREELGVDGVPPLRRIPGTKLLLERSHGLRSRVGRLVETKVELRDGDEGDGEKQRSVEQLRQCRQLLPATRHCA